MKDYVNPTTPELGDVQNLSAVFGPLSGQDGYRLAIYWAVPAR
jgi:hypothetical protein